MTQNSRLHTVTSGHTSIQQRSAIAERIDAALLNLTALRGVTAAAVVDADGLVTHIRRDFAINTDALGAGVQIVFGAAQRNAENVDQGTTKIVICENKDGYVLLAPVGSGFMLALCADSDALLGTIRFELKETLPTLAEIFNQ